MIDEVFEVEQYMAGENINYKNLYRICFLMVRWHKQCGYGKLQTREMLEAWAKSNALYIKYDCNDIINRVFDTEKGAELKTAVVKVNERDVKNINSRFDNKKTKLVALAFICFAKAHANKLGEFSLSMSSLSAWTGINRQMLGRKYIKELIDFEFLEKISKPEYNSMWDKLYEDQSTRYRLTFKVHNSGNDELVSNDLGILFSRLFGHP